jgi:hypothetical protein
VNKTTLIILGLIVIAVILYLSGYLGGKPVAVLAEDNRRGLTE